MAVTDGFRTADMDTMALYDDKVLLLRERYEDWPAYFAGYVALVLESWRIGRRMVYGSIHWNGLPSDCEPLVTVGLLDDSHRVPESVWLSWYGAAVTRRQSGRERQQRYRTGSSFSDRVPRP